jgi:5-methylcytosine-specific restriction endonuclease McrA
MTNPPVAAVSTERKPTSRKRKPAAVRDEADRLFSHIIRVTKGPLCQNDCGRPATDTAHIIGRTFSHTRTDTDNAFALCATCHANFHHWADDWLDFIDRTIGRAEYDRLRAKAEAGVRASKRFDWYEELDRLRALYEQLFEEAV